MSNDEHIWDDKYHSETWSHDLSFHLILIEEEISIWARAH